MHFYTFDHSDEASCEGHIVHPPSDVSSGTDEDVFFHETKHTEEMRKKIDNLEMNLINYQKISNLRFVTLTKDIQTLRRAIDLDAVNIEDSIFVWIFRLCVIANAAAVGAIAIRFWW